MDAYMGCFVFSKDFSESTGNVCDLFFVRNSVQEDSTYKFHKNTRSSAIC